MNRKLRYVYAAVFFVLCCLPLFLMPFVKNSGRIEKKELASLPAWVRDGTLNPEFPDQFESWLNDRMPFRSQILSAAGFLKGELLHVPSSNVIVGKDGWLFYNSESADYMDTNAMTEEQAARIAVTLSLMEEKTRSLGGRFTFVPVPNKSTVYGEYMPVFFTQGQTHNIDRVQETLEKAGVTCTDLKSVMTDQKALGLYHRRDSHWNGQGALLGYNAILDSLGREHETHEHASYTVEKTWRGDLDKLLYPSGGTLDYDYVYDIDHGDFTFVRPSGVKDPEEQLRSFMSDKEQGDDAFTTRNRERKDASRLYMVRDSFGRALLPYMIDSYELATFRRTDCPDLENLEAGTDVVYEIAERNLARVTSTAPYMFAPERDSADLPASDPASGGRTEPVLENAGYAWRLYGALPPAEEDAAGFLSDPRNARVFLVLSRGSETVILEAFPILESRYLEEDSGRGYSAYLSRDEGLSGSYEARIVTGGTAYDAGTLTFEEPGT